MEKTVKVYEMGKEPREREYWLNRPVTERFQTLEQLRQNFYGNASEGFQRVIESLNRNKVRYLIIGGYAVVYHGHVRSTNDIDIWVDIREGNIKRLMTALDEFGFSVLKPKQADFAPNQIIQLGYPPNRIDIITSPAGVSFDECYASREQVDLDMATVNFINLDNLLKSKRAAGRTRDLADIDELTE